jgi:purine-binding chemotaxis protein CheW
MKLIESEAATAMPIAPAARQAASRALDQARASSGAVELFGSFVLQGEEFALPAMSIREVVNFPTRIIPVPLAPAALEGVFTLRGHVIPVLNLARIVDPAAAPASASSKIAILDHEDILVGIAFDDIGEVLRVRPEQRSTLQYTEGAVHGVINGTIMLDDGDRLLQILDAHALVHVENVPQVRDLRAVQRAADKSQFHQRAGRRPCLSFRVGGTGFAFAMSAVREIIMVPELQSSVMASKLCLGRINFRGNPVAVIDFADLLRFAPGDERDSATQRILVVAIGASLVGLLVDAVDAMFGIYDSDILPIPLLSRTRAGMFAGYVTREDSGDLLFLNHDGIFSHAELAELGAGHVRLYQDEANKGHDADQHASSKAQRTTYITFTVESGWAVEIKQLREIILFSLNLVKPPGMPAFVHGILNLRQQVISVIDLRCRFGMAPLIERDAARILIVEHEGELVGLIVDAVDTIVQVPSSARRAYPRIMRENSEHFQATEVIDLGDDGATLSVFDSLAFLKRLRQDMAAMLD